MFEDTSDIGFDDNILEPCCSKRGPNSQEKRFISEVGSTSDKKVKLDNVSPICSDKFLEDSPSKFVARRFPGPAGLIFNTCDKENKLIPQSILKPKSINEQNEDLLCSQQTYSLYEEGSWKKMEDDFRTTIETPLYEKFNIQWIKLNSVKKKLLVSHKAPFLAAILDSLEIKDGKIPTINVTLKDKTGVIHGTVLHTLYEEYSDFFTVGSVLVLIQFGVLSIQNNHCITITPNNLLHIYHKKSGTKLGGKVNESIKKIIAQQCTVQEIWQKYREALSSHEQKYSNCKNAVQNREGVSRNYSKTFVPVPEVISQPTFINTVKPSEGSSSAQINSHSVEEENKFIFKKSNTPQSFEKLINSNENETNVTQVSFKPNNEIQSEILKNLFEGVDTSAFFEDF